MSTTPQDADRARASFGSLFTGIGGFDLGFERAGLGCAWQVEQDKHCQGILARHWEGVRRYADVCEVGDGLAAVDLICGGFPCQDLSVAGRRAGLAGERSGLWFEFARILGIVRPRWVVVENVPGLLSSNEGRDFAVVLRGLVELGYGVCWRILDAQHFGVAQRRRRVFVVGSLGDGASASVLFESESVYGDSPARGSQGEGLAPSLAARNRGGGGLGTDADLDGAVISSTLRSRNHSPGVNAPGRGGEDDENLIAYAVSPSRGTGDGHGNAWNSNYVAANLRASDGHHGHSSPRGDGNDNLVAGWDPRNITSKANRTRLIEGITPTLHENGMSVAFGWNKSAQSPMRIDDTTDALQASPQSNPAVSNAMGVRRLTPRECERLQGFPDDWTAGFADSVRYKMLGNAVAVPVAQWIGGRLGRAAAGEKETEDRNAQP